MGLSDPKTLPALSHLLCGPLLPWVQCYPFIIVEKLPPLARITISLLHLLTVLCPFSLTEQSGVGDAWLHVSSPTRLWSRVCGERISDWQRECGSENRMSAGTPVTVHSLVGSPSRFSGQQLLSLSFLFVKWCKRSLLSQLSGAYRMKCGKTGRLHLNVVVAWFIHRYVLNGCCVPDIGLGPGTLCWLTEPSPARSSQSARQTGSWWILGECSQPAESLILLCAASPPYHLAHCPKLTPGLQPVQGS